MHPAPSPPPGSADPVVLLVEDDPAHQVLVAAELEPAGVHVAPVDTMFGALEMLALQRGAFDVVVVDLGLPDIDGMNSLETILQAVGVPVIVHSGSVEPELAERARRIGAAAVVPKDAGSDALLAAVGEVLGDRPAPLLGVPPGMGTEAVAADFEEAARRTLEFLQAHVPMGAWMVTRVVGEDWVVLDAVGQGYDVAPNSVLRWSDSFCSRMVEGEGPNVTTAVSELPVYRQAPVFDQLDIETYVGLPLAIEGEGLFGTLCGIDPGRSTVPLETLEPFLLHIADLLTTALALDLERDRLQRRLDLAKVASRTDALTGLPNRRAFDLLLKLEEARCRRFGSSATILVMDLDGLKVRNDTEGHAAGDGYLRAAGAALSSVVRASDMAFRIGGDEFAVIAAPAPAVPETLVSRVNKALATGGVEASVGIATRRPDESLDDVLSRADERMYDLKRRRSTRLGHPPAG